MTAADAPDFHGWPTFPLWAYSLSVYALPGVAPACLELQDRFGTDVNVLLAALFWGLRSGVAWSDDDLREVLRRSSEWQRGVVMPLRNARRAAATAARKKELQRAEIAAEYCEQRLLAGVVPGGIPANESLDPVDPVAAAARNLVRYAASRAPGNTDASLSASLAALLVTASGIAVEAALAQLVAAQHVIGSA